MEEIFIYAIDDGKPIIVLASEAKKFIDSKSKSTYLQLKDGVKYQGIFSKENVTIGEFSQYNKEIISGESKKSLSIYTKI